MSLESIPISTGTRKHLVDTNDMEWVCTDSEMERIFSNELRKILVATDTSSLERLT